MDYKFDEDKSLSLIQTHINNTYSKHYSSGKYQATDMIVDAGHGEGFCMGNIMKYAMRYGKKEGRNQIDLLKLIHYAIIAYYIGDKEGHYDNG
tara:strand:- start:16 stop:294 length:279 start_codon:yes stop_codon:yes gene_type:complete